MNLTTEIIRSYGFPEKTRKPDWDDVEIVFTLPNGIELGCLTVCNNEPCEMDSLEGLDGFIYIETKEELDELLALTCEQVIQKVAEENEDFEIDEYL